MELTGNLGDVMKESANIAYTVARSVLHRENPDNSFLSNRRIHVHVPEASIDRVGWFCFNHCSIVYKLAMHSLTAVSEFRSS